MSGIVAGTVSTLFLARRLFGSDVFSRRRSNSLSPQHVPARSTYDASDDTGVVHRSSWPNKISQFNPFRRQGYDLINDGSGAL